MKIHPMTFVQHLLILSGGSWLTLNLYGFTNNNRELTYNWQAFFSLLILAIGVAVLFSLFTHSKSNNPLLLTPHPLANYGILFNAFLLIKLITDQGETTLTHQEQLMLLSAVIFVTTIAYNQNRTKE